jgi:ATP-dependent RNA helicase DDX42
MTGSGKTLSYVIPTVIHLLGNDSPKLPRAAIICPTRELAIQIEEELYRFAKRSNERFKSIALTGGLSKYEQFQMMIKGCDVIVGNPGRMIDLLQMKKGLDLSGITLCVLDEADRMFSMGFESQLRTIVQRIRPDRQMLMFSATMPPRIERLAREIMNDPVRVVVGSIGQAANVIDQNVFLVHSDEEKYVWIAATLPPLIAQGGRILIFVNTKSTLDALLHRARQILGTSGKVVVGSIHGDLDQTERMRIMNEFKTGRCPVLIATDVAARGIDVSGVTCVIEFDAAKNFDTHTHRIGRTGRAGSSGTSWTLLMPNERRIAAHIVESIEALGIKSPPADLVAFAMKHPPFREAHKASTGESPEEISETGHSWEPLDEHFKKGRTESLD